MTRREMICYAAGFFDGEGSIHLNWYHGNIEKAPNIRFVVYNSELPPLELFVELFGGKIRVTEPRNKGWKPVYSWINVGRLKLIPVLKELLPFIREPVKRTRIEYYLNNYRLLDRSANRAKLLSEAQQQNRIQFIQNWPELNENTIQKLEMVMQGVCYE